jgi:sugar/nucleoside kinase (ribokinase family)
MTELDPFRAAPATPTAVGAGFVALDFIIHDGQQAPAQVAAGGSCGNVMAILAHLGWNSHPIARLDRSKESNRLVKDLKAAGASTKLITRSTTGSTPRVLHIIHDVATTGRTHSFRTRCQYCGAWFPTYKPITRQRAQVILKKAARAEAFYFDRASPATIKLAQQYHDNGAVVCFEPNSVPDLKLFKAALKAAHILKYSAERLERVEGLEGHLAKLSVPLHIETLGEAGLRYRVNQGDWRILPALKATMLRDTAGAGDWLTAGILHGLASSQGFAARAWKEKGVEAAIAFGQAMAAVNCAFIGARGAMRDLDLPTFQATVREILKRRQPASRPATERDSKVAKGPSQPPRICFSCTLADELDPAAAQHARPNGASRKG